MQLEASFLGDVFQGGNGGGKEATRAGTQVRAADEHLRLRLYDLHV